MADNDTQKSTVDVSACCEVYREIGEVLGTKAMLEVYNMFRGQQITFPVRLYSSERIKEKIISEYDGKNIKSLAKKYSYSEKTISRMIKKP